MNRSFWIPFLAFPFFCFGEVEEEEALFLRRIADFWQEGELDIAKNQIRDFLAAYPKSEYSNLLYRALGDLLLREKDYSAALSYYDRIDSEEEKGSLFLNRMQCLYQGGAFAPLIESCEEKLAKEGLDADTRLQITYYLAISLYQQCLQEGADLEQAKKHGQKAVPYFKTLFEESFSREIGLAYAHLLSLLDQPQAASDIYEELGKIAPEEKDDFAFFSALTQVKFDKTKAESSFRDLFQNGGKRAKEAAYNWLVLLYETDKLDTLLEEKGALLSSIPLEKIGSAHLFLGRAYLKLKKYGESVLEFQKFLEGAEKGESLHPALVSLLEAAFHADDFEAFDRAVETLKNQFPEDKEIPIALFSRAQMLKKSGRIQEARSSLEGLIKDHPQSPQKALALFELAHLDTQNAFWEKGIEWSRLFLDEFPEHELSGFVWRYLMTSLLEESKKQPEKKELLSEVLEKALETPSLFKEKERSEWEFAYAKVLFDRGEYEKTISLLHPLLEKEYFPSRPNALMLLALCYREGENNLSAYIELAEKALLEKADLIEPGAVHLSLFNLYLDQSKDLPESLDLAAEHLFKAVLLKKEIQKENLLWLVETYLSRGEKTDPLLYAGRVVEIVKPLIQEGKNPEEIEVYSLAKAYALLQDSAALIDLLPPFLQKGPFASKEIQTEVEFLLAKAYLEKGEAHLSRALFNKIVEESPNLRSNRAASSCLMSAKIEIARCLKEKIPFTHPEWQAALLNLKNLTLQKSLPNEPVHLEAALEYIELQSQTENSLEKKISLLEKTILDFEKTDDLLSKDYHAAKNHFPQKALIHQGYLSLMEAEILLSRAEMTLEKRKELQAKGKDLLLKIIDQNAHFDLTCRAKERLERIGVQK